MPQMNNTDPMFGRPNWTYVQIQAGPVRGPQPRLAQGTGRTGNKAYPGTAGQLPSYVSDNEYDPSPFEYAPEDRQDFLKFIPRSIAVGENGREMIGTYEPHDFTPGQRFNHQMRRAENWQVMEYPVNYRNLIQWQQVQRYRVSSFTKQARPLAASDYFLGYQVDNAIQARIGQSTLGYMGSM